MLTMTLPNAWILLHPTRRLDADYWVEVDAMLRSTGIDPTKATVGQVRSVFNVLDKTTKWKRKLKFKTSSRRKNLRKRSGQLGIDWMKLLILYILKLYNAVQNHAGVTLTPLETRILYTIITSMIKTTKAISDMDFVISKE